MNYIPQFNYCECTIFQYLSPSLDSDVSKSLDALGQDLLQIGLVKPVAGIPTVTSDVLWSRPVEDQASILVR